MGGRGQNGRREEEKDKEEEREREGQGDGEQANKKTCERGNEANRKTGEPGEQENMRTGEPENFGVGNKGTGEHSKETADEVNVRAPEAPI